MNEKKNPQIDINKRKSMLINLGLCISLTLTIVAFEWKTYDEIALVDLTPTPSEFDPIMKPPITVIPPPKPPQPKPVNIIEKDDDEPIEDIVIDLDTELPESVEDIIIEPDLPVETIEEAIDFAEVMPEFPGGNAAFYQFVNSHIDYPSKARRMGVQGKVYVQFIVDKDGSVTDVKVVKGIGSGCDEEAERVLKLSPKFKPGKQGSRPARVRMILPIVFKLGN